MAYLRCCINIDGTVKAFGTDHSAYTVPAGKVAVVNYAELFASAGGKVTLKRVTAAGAFAPIYRMPQEGHKALGRFVLQAGDRIDVNAAAATSLWLSISEESI